MEILEFQWDIKTIAKIIDKHGVYPSEVEEVFQTEPLILSAQNIFYALGRAQSGRYLIVVFRKLSKNAVKVISARQMTKAEKKRLKR